MKIMRARASLKFLQLSLLLIVSNVYASTPLQQLQNLQKAYPNFIKRYNANTITWADGSQVMINASAVKNSPSLLEQLDQPSYPSNKDVICERYTPRSDPGRIRNEAFFAKMYGQNEDDVRGNLEKIYWMPLYFGHQYPLFITRINDVNKKLKLISDQLEELVKKHPDYLKYLDQPSGTFYWRHIQNSNRRSPHSFGIAIDLNSRFTNYWIWDTGITENNINQADRFPYKNKVPCEIVSIFENNGFIWGGKWTHYDTMHFEYRPEFFN